MVTRRERKRKRASGMERAITKSLNKNPPPLITSIIRVAPQPVNIPRAILSLVENLSRGLFFQNEKREKTKRKEKTLPLPGQLLS